MLGNWGGGQTGRHKQENRKFIKKYGYFPVFIPVLT